MMSRNFFSAAVAAITLALTTAGTGSAAPGDCSSELDAVATAIMDGDFRNDKDQTRLDGKGIQAQAKVDLDKCSDALDKLGDIDDKVSALSDGNRKQKLPPEDAMDIMDETAIAVQCIASISTCIENHRPNPPPR